MGLISIGGLGSGLDTQSIVEALVNAERAPKENSLNRYETDVTVSLTGLGGLKSSLDELKSAAFDLSLSSSFNKRSVNISDNSFFTATASSTATEGDYDIEVVALAQGSFHKSKVFTGGATTTFGTGGTLTFTVGSNTFNIAVTSSDSLADIRNNINAATDNDLVSVNLLNNVTELPDTGSLLTFDSTTFGTGNDLVVTFIGDASLADLSTGLSKPQDAGDASIKIDGIVATSSSNTFTDVIQDITLNLKKTHEAAVTDSLSVSVDTASTKALITGFVEAYNAYTEVIKTLGSADVNSPGILIGDSTLRQVSSQVRNLFSSTIKGVSGEFDSLSSIGIKSTQDGKIEIDNTVLDNAIANNFDQFDELFSSENGFATKLRSLVDDYTNSSGIISSRLTSLTGQLDRISDDRLNLQLKIDSLELRLTKQFAAMDAIVAQFNSTRSYLAQQFENLPGFGGKKK